MARRGIVLVALAAAVLVTAGGALASFTAGTSAPQALDSATLAPATAVAAVNGACVSNKSLQVTVTWSATTSAGADGYDILRSTTAGGPFASIGTVSGTSTTTFTDTTPLFSTTYYYVVESKKNTWRSTASAATSLLTLTKSCK